MITVRRASPRDADAIRAVTVAAFGQPDEAGLVERLQADGHLALSWVAALDGEVVAHAALSPLVSPDRALALAPVSVRPDLQGRGLGSAVVSAILAQAHTDGWDAVFVLGDPCYCYLRPVPGLRGRDSLGLADCGLPTRPSDGRFRGPRRNYGRFGFDAARASGWTGTWAGPHLQVLVLSEGFPATGHVRWAPAFGESPPVGQNQ